MARNDRGLNFRKYRPDPPQVGGPGLYLRRDGCRGTWNDYVRRGERVEARCRQRGGLVWSCIVRDRPLGVLVAN
jgi:hypothetical protein